MMVELSYDNIITGEITINYWVLELRLMACVEGGAAHQTVFFIYYCLNSNFQNH